MDLEFLKIRLISDRLHLAALADTCRAKGTEQARKYADLYNHIGNDLEAFSRFSEMLNSTVAHLIASNNHLLEENYQLESQLFKMAQRVNDLEHELDLLRQIDEF